jgi:hypothetical protein
VNDFHSRPDWVIIGAPLQDRYVVWASRELDHVELEMVYTDVDPYDWYGYSSWSVPRFRHIKLRGQLRSVVVVLGTSYADCLARLADFGEPGEWRDVDHPVPELPAHPELPTPRRALGPGGERT